MLRARVLCLAALAISLLGSCGKPDDGGVLLVLKSLNNPFFVDIQRGFEEEWLKVGGGIPVAVKAGSREDDINAQRTILNSQHAQLVSGRAKSLIKGVILTPSSSGADLVPQIKNFRDAGVPVILLDTVIEKKELELAKTNYNLLVASDNHEGGRRAAAELAKGLQGKECRILILNGVPGQDTAQERRDGFMEELTKHPPCVVALEKAANWQRREANTIVGLLAGNWQFTGVFAANDEMALGAVAALQQSNVAAKPLIVGFDATKDAVDAVHEKRMYATIAQDPAEMGRRAARALAEYLKSPALMPSFKTEWLPPNVVN